MKHDSGTAADSSDLAEAASRMGVRLTTEQEALLLEHLDLVLERNERLNLTAVRDRADALARHVLDSLSAAPALAEAPSGRFADLGSGAGYPGIPLAIVSGRPVSLVESIGKKAAFLSEALAVLGVSGSVVAERSECLAGRAKGAFACVTARAVAGLSALLELASPLLSVGGLLIAMKGAPEDQELQEGDAAAQRVGMVRVRLERVSVPRIDEPRSLVIYRRIGEPDLPLPRRPGMAVKRPLG